MSSGSPAMVRARGILFTLLAIVAVACTDQATPTPFPTSTPTVPATSTPTPTPEPAAMQGMLASPIAAAAHGTSWLHELARIMLSCTFALPRFEI